MEENSSYDYYKKSIDRISRGEVVNDKILFVTSLPKFGVEGLDELSVYIHPTIIQKIMAGHLEEEGLLPANYEHKNKHNVKVQDIKDFPFLLENPLAIAEVVRFDRWNNPKLSYIFFTDRFEEKVTPKGVFNDHLGVVLRYLQNEKGERYFIASAYGYRMSQIQKNIDKKDWVFINAEKLKTLKGSMLSRHLFRHAPEYASEACSTLPLKANFTDKIHLSHVLDNGGIQTDRAPLSDGDVNKMVEDWQVGDSKEEKKALVLFVAEQLEPEEGEEMLNTKGIFVEAITLMQIKNALSDEMKTQLYDELVKDKEQGIGGRE